MMEQSNEVRAQGNDSRRRQLRTLLVTAAGDARQTRQTPIFTAVIAPAARPSTRERVTMLLSAAG
ncbi:MAG TPA: hypothetical protein VGM50_22020 [Gemmatimonadaceae bacterium]